MNKRIELKIYGRVQGVFYRDSARRRAGNLNITGFTKNEPDGTVRLVAEGEEENLKKFIKWCYNGSILAKVVKVDIEYKQATGEFKNFNIVY